MEHCVTIWWLGLLIVEYLCYKCRQRTYNSVLKINQQMWLVQIFICKSPIQSLNYSRHPNGLLLVVRVIQVTNESKILKACLQFEMCDALLTCYWMLLYVFHQRDGCIYVNISVIRVSNNYGALIFQNQCLVHSAQPKDPTRTADNAIKPVSHNFRLQYDSLFSIFSQSPARDIVFAFLSRCRTVYTQVLVKTLTFIISPSGRERKWKTAFKFHWRHYFNLESSVNGVWNESKRFSRMQRNN